MNHSPRFRSPSSSESQPRSITGGALARHLAVCSALALFLAAIPLQAQPATIEQTFTLQPGWNSIFLTVKPADRNIESVFAGIPVRSVWHWTRAETTAEFIEDPADGLIPSAEWQGYFPRPRPEAFLTNLFGVLPNEPYLVELGGTQPVTLRVVGTPSLAPRQRWIADGFTLTGFFVDPAGPPSFGLYLSPSEAHTNQPLYALDTTGHWQPVSSPATTPIAPGTAYWVYTKGGSEYQGPVEIFLDGRTNADYTAALTVQPWTLRNKLAFDVDIQVRRLSAPFPVPLSYEVFDDETGGFSYADIGSSLTVETPGSGERSLNVAVRRANFTVNRVEQIFEIKNGAGFRRFILVGANSVQPAAALGAARDEPPTTRTAALLAQRQAGSAGIHPYAGLWVASVAVNKVSESQLAGTTPTPTGKSFPMRLLIHVDGIGQARLLREVIQLYQDGTMEPDPNNPGFLRTATLGHYALITDDSLIPNFEGVAMRDGTLVGLRISSSSYDLPSDTLDMTGAVGLTGILRADLVLPFDAPTNPYLHKFHPDHDNLDAQFLNTRAEAFTITRKWTLTFTPNDPRLGTDENANPPSWGDSTLGGLFVEELTGLHRNRIFAAGTFTMRRIAATPVLNQ